MNEQQQQEMRRLRRLLAQMYKIAEQASLTGTFDGGGAEIVSRYNLILSRLDALGIDMGGLFPPLPEDADLDRVGIACKLLSGYLDDEDEPKHGPNFLIGNLHGLPDGEHLKDIGRIVRENLAEAFAHRPMPPTPPTPPTPPPPPFTPNEAPSEAPTEPRW